MTNFNMNEATSNVDAHGGTLPKPEAGDYNVMISKADIETNKGKNGSNLVMEYSIIDGDFQGSVVKEWLAVINKNDQAQNIARSKLKAIQIVSDCEGQEDVSSLIGKTIRIRISKEPHEFINNNGEKVKTFNNNVLNYMDMDNKNAKGDTVPAFVQTDKPEVKESGNQKSAQTSKDAFDDLDDEIPF